MSTPLLSVVIPTYNRKDLLKECLDSLLDQTYPKEDYEIVVVDDGSTDGTEDMLRQMSGEHGNLRYFRQENGGMFPAWNKAASLAKGDILVMTDSDCVAPDDFIESAAKCFRRNPDVAACTGISVPISKNNMFSPLSRYLKRALEAHKRSERVFFGLDPCARLHSDCAAIKKDAFIAVGCFDSKFNKAVSGGDLDVGYKLLKIGRGICIGGGMLIYHRQRESLGCILKRDFVFGMSDVENFRDHFRGWAGIRLHENRYINLTGCPVTLVLNMNMLKIFIFLLVLTAFLPVPGIILSALYLMWRYLNTWRSGGNVRSFIIFIAYRLLTDTPRLAGWIAGSIRYGVIYL